MSDEIELSANPDFIEVDALSADRIATVVRVTGNDGEGVPVVVTGVLVAFATSPEGKLLSVNLGGWGLVQPLKIETYMLPMPPVNVVVLS